MTISLPLLRPKMWSYLWLMFLSLYPCLISLEILWLYLPIIAILPPLQTKSTVLSWSKLLFLSRELLHQSHSSASLSNLHLVPCHLFSVQESEWRFWNMSVRAYSLLTVLHDSKPHLEEIQGTYCGLLSPFNLILIVCLPPPSSIPVCHITNMPGMLFPQDVCTGRCFWKVLSQLSTWSTPVLKAAGMENASRPFLQIWYKHKLFMQIHPNLIFNHYPQSQSNYMQVIGSYLYFITFFNSFHIS